MKWLGVIIVALIGELAFAERYRRFAPLARQAVFGQYLAAELEPKPEPDATGGAASSPPQGNEPTV